MLLIFNLVGFCKQVPQKQEGADYETAQRIVMALACFHAKYWDNSENALTKLREQYCPLAENDSYWVRYFFSFLFIIDLFIYFHVFILSLLFLFTNMLKKENLQTNLEKSIDDFATLVRDKEVQKTSQFCASHIAELVKTSHNPPVTVLHGDARAANYFLEGIRGVVAVDWQGLEIGSGPGMFSFSFYFFNFLISFIFFFSLF